MSVHIMKVYCLECDICGEGHDAPGATTMREARTDAETAGWIRARDRHTKRLVDVCRDCAKKV